MAKGFDTSMNTSNTKRDKLLSIIAKAIEGIREEILKVDQGEQALDGIEQLQFIKSRLSEMEKSLLQENWKTTERKKPGIARVVVDTWPIDNQLGDLISQAEYEFIRLK